jgi:putative membrane protein
MKNLFMNFSWVIIIVAVGAIACNTASNNTASNNGTNRANVNLPASTPANANVVANSNAAPGGDFMSEAASGGMTEVELGKIASTKAQNAEVKKFAEMMVTDHTKANDELKALAVKKNITLPTTPNAKHQAAIQKFQGMSGAGFDKAYVDDMLEDHEKDVAEFEKQSQSNPDADVKAFAAKTLPTLKKHLDAIKALHDKIK